MASYGIRPLPTGCFLNVQLRADPVSFRAKSIQHQVNTGNYHWIILSLLLNSRLQQAEYWPQIILHQTLTVVFLGILEM